MDIEELDFSLNIPEHRIDRNTLDSIEEILSLTLTAVICGCEGWRDIERFGHSNLSFLQTLFPFKHGVPSDDTLRRFFRTLCPDVFRHCFTDWLKTLRLTCPEYIAIIKNMTLNLLPKAKGKRDSIKQLRKAAGWEDVQLHKILAHN